MNCDNCGAAMQLHHVRGYFFCTHCGSFRFPQPPDDRGLRVIGREAAPPPCPACRAPLAAAKLDERAVHVCEACHGVLLSRGAFADVIRTRRAWASGPPSVPPARDERELAREVTCPVCERAMATHPYLGPGRVVIDTCDTCDVIWLDAGELRHIVDAPGRDRGARDMPPEPWTPPAPGAADVDEDERRPDLLSQLLELLR